MESLMTIWAWIYLIGLASFFLLALAIVPLGGRDLMSLFRTLSGRDKDEEGGAGKEADIDV